MPGYVNIGSYVGSGTMVDTWATVGSGAQIGRNVHLAAGSASAACWSRRVRCPW
jgi:2,3,4,5-tetrahydropyridine-2-carboxylate N-succinyltransferase